MDPDPVAGANPDAVTGIGAIPAAVIGPSYGGGARTTVVATGATTGGGIARNMVAARMIVAGTAATIAPSIVHASPGHPTPANCRSG